MTNNAGNQAPKKKRVTLRTGGRGRGRGRGRGKKRAISSASHNIMTSHLQKKRRKTVPAVRDDGAIPAVVQTDNKAFTTKSALEKSIPNTEFPKPVGKRKRVVENSAISPPIMKANTAAKPNKLTAAELRAKLMAKMKKKPSQAKAPVPKPKPVPPKVVEEPPAIPKNKFSLNRKPQRRLVSFDSSAVSENPSVKSPSEKNIFGEESKKPEAAPPTQSVKIKEEIPKPDAQAPMTVPIVPEDVPVTLDDLGDMEGLTDEFLNDIMDVMNGALEDLGENPMDVDSEFTEMNVPMIQADIIGWDLENLQKELDDIRAKTF